jgi:hypothetical protein
MGSAGGVVLEEVRLGGGDSSNGLRIWNVGGNAETRDDVSLRLGGPCLSSLTVSSGR